MLYRVIVFITVAVWTVQVFAGEEISIGNFLNHIENDRLSGKQIRVFTEGEKIEAFLRRAQEQQREYVIEKLLNARDEHNDTPLLSAVASNNEKLVQMLLDAGADPNKINKRKLVSVMIFHQGYKFHNRFPLAVAALSTKSPKMVQLLLDKGAFDPDYKSGDVADHLATTVLKSVLYGRNSVQEKTDLREIQSMLELAARQRLLADTLGDTKLQDQKRNAGQDVQQDGGQDGGPEEKSGDVSVQGPGESPAIAVRLEKLEEYRQEQKKSWWESRCIIS